ncbi:unnamed protein product [Cylicocyclus nassatus]|uniref:Defensin n=1 Tax=Cylicocyclus nassatus TaxID=53992 RepID=A0AA36HBK3_CYLNA|nr:unnamed protein product [Cylicocyclus nassatus]CAJ0607593.1 unnamed protein product [Cylicocyclus nassatus]
MMRHFVAFTLLLIALVISVEATKWVPDYLLCSRFGDSACRARCLKQSKCGNCKIVFEEEVFSPKCFCEDCRDQQRKKQLH